MKKTMKRLLSLCLVLILAMALIAPAASAEDYPEYHWIAALNVAETTINYMIVDQFAQLLNERSGGKVKLDVYPSSAATMRCSRVSVTGRLIF